VTQWFICPRVVPCLLCSFSPMNQLLLALNLVELLLGYRKLRTVGALLQ